MSLLPPCPFCGCTMAMSKPYSSGPWTLRHEGPETDVCPLSQCTCDSMWDTPDGLVEDWNRLCKAAEVLIGAMGPDDALDAFDFLATGWSC